MAGKAIRGLESPDGNFRKGGTADKHGEDDRNGLPTMLHHTHQIRGSLQPPDDRGGSYLSGEASGYVLVTGIQGRVGGGVLDKKPSVVAFTEKVTTVGRYSSTTGGVQGLLFEDVRVSGVPGQWMKGGGGNE